VLVWQAAATVIIAAIAGAWVGFHGALSAVLGGVVNLSAGVVYAFVLAIAPGKTAGATMMALFRAEAAKILVIIGQLWSSSRRCWRPSSSRYCCFALPCSFATETDVFC